MKIAFLGDMAFLENGILQRDWKKELSDAEKVLRDFDIIAANLETPLTDRKHTLTCKGIHLKSGKKVTDILKYLHVTVVSLANNHIYDFGRGG